MKTASALVITTAVIAVFAVPRISHSQTAERGRAIFQALTQKYPKVQPCGWSLATANPKIALFIPQTEWAELPREDQASLTLYVESLIPAVRANPDRYIAAFQNEPLRDIFRAKVAHLCAECWLIGVGPLTLDQKGVLYEQIVVEGDLAWERDDPRSRGVKASEFRRGLQSVALAGKETDRTEERQQGIVAIAEHDPNAWLAVRASRGTGQSKVQAPSSSGPPVDLGSQSRSQREQEARQKAEASKRAAAVLHQRWEQLEEEAGRRAEEQRRKSAEARMQLGQMGRSYSGTTLIESAENGDTPMVDLLLTVGMSPHTQDAKGWTALMYAAWNGHTTTVRALLDRGADVNAKNETDGTALIMAAMGGHTAIVHALLNRGADVNAKDREGWTALMYAAWNGHTPIVHALLNRGADVNAKDREGWTALMYAAWNGHTPIVHALLDSSADANAKNNEGKTVLTAATRQGDSEIVKLLKQAGARE